MGCGNRQHHALDRLEIIVCRIVLKERGRVHLPQRYSDCEKTLDGVPNREPSLSMNNPYLKKSREREIDLNT
jgi:hypothetical protein